MKFAGKWMVPEPIIPKGGKLKRQTFHISLMCAISFCALTMCTLFILPTELSLLVRRQEEGRDLPMEGT